ncbi:hypothetical protein Aple_100530 [Acrocarpospora pleiomorpha]|uniref:DUF4328 domain-containing protein n=1 Tax=Acrocarpospora pleiomorpha TaxID=90975 RepID=A0A5M3Y1H4_9ACTN|nr:DUF4328 domain-containing protein [Acrocarpospora pleiomorpha]GES27154.1 hypothetical protein Aple_100530 [Acrocarpospora pleiomorpha]
MYPLSFGPVRPARGLAVTVAIMIVINLVVETLSALVSLQRYSIIGDVIENPQSIDLQAVEDNDTLYAGSGILQLATLVIAGVCYWIWLFRVRANAEALDPTVTQRRGKPWLIFGWFLPIVSFWFPKQIINDIWTASEPRRRPPGGLVLAWWLTWILSAIGENVLGRLLLAGEELEQLRTVALLEVVVFPLTLVSGVLAIVVVNKITALQAQPRPAPAPVYPDSQYPQQTPPRPY